MRTLQDQLTLAYDLAAEWNVRYPDLQLRVIAPAINFDALRRERTLADDDAGNPPSQ